MTGFKFEHALKLLVEYFPEEKQKKPTLFHCMRVGAFLWRGNYSEDIQIAGLLHDALEDTSLPENIIETLFWKDVLQIVQANSEDNTLEISKQKEDIVQRCAQVGENAMIVKMADVYDNYLFYVQQQNVPEIERCQKFASYILKYKKSDWIDPIFQKAEVILEWK